MKQAKKLASLLLALVMVLALATTAFAAQEGSLTGGSITVDNAVVGETYKIYQILYLESYNSTTDSYAYKANSAWETWLRTQTTYVSFDNQDYVTWKQGADAAAFAKLAQEEAAKKTADGTSTASSTTVEFKGLKLGYYLLDSSMGALCSLDTTNPDVTIEEKNEKPSIDKTVKGGSSNSFGENNTAQVGDTVEFQIVVHAKKGAQNYVLHDKLSAGLTLNADSIAVASLAVNTDYTVKTSSNADGCSFEITFTDSYLNTITTATDITVTYSAVVNENAVVVDAGKNQAKLDYGDNSETEWDETKTETREFDIVKTDASFKLLAGAEFELYDAQTGGNKINLFYVTAGEGAPYYRPAVSGETPAVIETTSTGKITVKGLAGKTYWLEETKAPDGYNKLAGRQQVDLTNGNLNTTMTGTTWQEGNGGVHIVNQSGTELPSTGGIGTTLFYVLGSILVIGAAVLLVTKKRMGAKN